MGTHFGGSKNLLIMEKLRLGISPWENGFRTTIKHICCSRYLYDIQLQREHIEANKKPA